LKSIDHGSPLVLRLWGVAARAVGPAPTIRISTFCVVIL
jgi:hypothetical protein